MGLFTRLFRSKRNETINDIQSDVTSVLNAVLCDMRDASIDLISSGYVSLSADQLISFHNGKLCHPFPDSIGATVATNDVIQSMGLKRPERNRDGYLASFTAFELTAGIMLEFNKRRKIFSLLESGGTSPLNRFVMQAYSSRYAKAIQRKDFEEMQRLFDSSTEIHFLTECYATPGLAHVRATELRPLFVGGNTHQYAAIGW